MRGMRCGPPKPASLCTHWEEDGEHCSLSVMAIDVLHTHVAALQVAPSDKIGRSDAALILKSCTAGGKLLQGDKPAMSIDAQNLKMVRRQHRGRNSSTWWLSEVLCLALQSSIAVLTQQWHAFHHFALYHRARASFFLCFGLVGVR